MICQKSDCTGCHACYNICPKKAISMIEDEFGSIYPKIDKEKCINCNLCKKVCPALNKTNTNQPLNCYAMQVKNREKLQASTSGGAATIISEKFIKNNGIVYGCAFEKGFKIHHIRIDNINDLKKLRGSKYVHSYIEDSYKNVKKDLDNNRMVLFIATPCQIAGLKRYLLREYNNLYTIDIVCHGVPSQKLLKEELINNVGEKALMESNSIQFRSDEGFVLKLKSKDKVIYKKNINDSEYYYGFYKSIFYRDNCYTCQYASSYRVSDLTIGDFWGLGEDSKFYGVRNKGVSLLLPLTEKGQKLIDLSKNDIDLEERDIIEALKGNDQLNHPAVKNNKNEKFKKIYPSLGLKKSIKKVDIKRRVKNYLKKFKTVKFIIKKIKRR